VVAFIASFVMLLIGVGVVMFVGQRRPPGTPLTWAEAMLGAVFLMGLFVLAYGVVPNQFLLWADNELNWRADAIAYVLRFWGRGQVVITKQAIRDIIVTVIYVVMLGVNVALWAQWQKRGRAKETPAIETSTFGRPLVRKA
jgi:hypothetical protein